MHSLLENFLLVIAIPFCAWIFCMHYRIKNIHKYEIENYNYSVDRNLKLIPWLKEFARDCLHSYSLKNDRTYYHAFISYKRVPDERDAFKLCELLVEKGLKIGIVESRLESDELLRNIGDDVGIGLHLDHRLFQSSVVVSIASSETFLSYWTLYEITNAMMFSNAIILVLSEKKSVYEILPLKSLIFRRLIAAPVYAIESDGDISSTTDRIASVLKKQKIGKGRIQSDFLAFIIISTLSIIFVVGKTAANRNFEFSYNLSDICILITISLLVSIIVPCRKRMTNVDLGYSGFNKILKGWNADIIRIIGFFIFTSGLWLIVNYAPRSFPVILAPIWFMFCGIIPGIHSSIQIGLINSHNRGERLRIFKRHINSKKKQPHFKDKVKQEFFLKTQMLEGLALVFLEKEKFLSAIGIYTDFLKQRPDSTMGWYGIAYALYQLSSYEMDLEKLKIGMQCALRSIHEDGSNEYAHTIYKMMTTVTPLKSIDENSIVYYNDDPLLISKLINFNGEVIVSDFHTIDSLEDRLNILMLIKYNEKKYALDLLLHAIWDPNSDVRAAALKTIGHWGSNCEVRSELEKLVESNLCKGIKYNLRQAINHIKDCHPENKEWAESLLKIIN